MLYIRDNNSKINDSILYFAEIYDYDKANTNIVFDEFKIIEKDNTYLIIGKVNTIDKFNVKSSNNYQESGEFIYIIVHKEPYKQYNAALKQSVERSVDSFEIAVDLLIKHQYLNLNQVYSGSFLISNIAYAVTAKDFPDTALALMPKIKENFKVTPCLNVQYLNNEKIIFGGQNQYKNKSTSIYEEKEKYIFSKLAEVESYFNIKGDNLAQFFFEYLHKDESTKYAIEQYLKWLALIIK